MFILCTSRIPAFAIITLIPNFKKSFKAYRIRIFNPAVLLTIMHAIVIPSDPRKFGFVNHVDFRASGGEDKEKS